MSAKLERLSQNLRDVFGETLQSLVLDCGEVTIEVAASDYLRVARTLRDHEDLHFEQLIDISGLDFSAYGNASWTGKRFASSAHLTSIRHNWRLRLRAFAEDEAFPVLDSVVEIWPSANWFERESFDLYGIMYAGHPDLRRILTDYGFVGHPFRKDFPVSGYVEMRYDPEQGRVVYQPVTIEPRENTPRIVREENYGDVGHG
ncbi:NADH-quinone oxidoreductase subunit C [Thauera linaloolentis]|uniref:NADH-quinone oxidoreductase subunit C n=1 Tax=Thauera linaloolentis (strain DSM 12138 / JCM 21573 / CCUG 41526 / CIP 105981 / IAM 15112 / NBRC 102519 / 47Lol) TaxID=1123367 RepID=N6Y733_THAL4|nr:NADH-quinone oxidoreductase subunit C [Thauera linaloolentis]ENO90071.1 NADH dehydrogenase subunit C [Thauera linaloolentis 47Lol = DSM 12138]MCM8565355.1 NADH-quinone oxidoreductase subunit C [Thauera linaloolentis]